MPSTGKALACSLFLPRFTMLTQKVRPQWPVMWPITPTQPKLSKIHVVHHGRPRQLERTITLKQLSCPRTPDPKPPHHFWGFIYSAVTELPYMMSRNTCTSTVKERVADTCIWHLNGFKEQRTHHVDKISNPFFVHFTINVIWHLKCFIQPRKRLIIKMGYVMFSHQEDWDISGPGSSKVY